MMYFSQHLHNKFQLTNVSLVCCFKTTHQKMPGKLIASPPQHTETTKLSWDNSLHPGIADCRWYKILWLPLQKSIHNLFLLGPVFIDGPLNLIDLILDPWGLYKGTTIYSYHIFKKSSFEWVNYCCFVHVLCCFWMRFAFPWTVRLSHNLIGFLYISGTSTAGLKLNQKKRFGGEKGCCWKVLHRFHQQSDTETGSLII